MTANIAPVPALYAGPIAEFMESYALFFSILYIAAGIFFIYAGISNIMMVLRLKKNKPIKKLWKEYRPNFIGSGIGILVGILLLTLGIFLTTKI